MSAKDRLAEAAFALFAERGYDRTTVDDITERAGVGRTTFFRAFRTKEDVIFPDHEVLLRAIEERLRGSTGRTALIAVTEAARLVLRHYLAEGERALTRYRLTRSVPALRDREIAGVRQYQRLFRVFLHRWTWRCSTRRSSHSARTTTGSAATSPKWTLTWRTRCAASESTP